MNTVQFASIADVKANDCQKEKDFFGITDDQARKEYKNLFRRIVLAKFILFHREESDTTIYAVFFPQMNHIHALEARKLDICKCNEHLFVGAGRIVKMGDQIDTIFDSSTCKDEFGRCSPKEHADDIAQILATRIREVFYDVPQK